MQKSDLDNPVYSLLYDDIDYLWRWLEDMTVRSAKEEFPTFTLTIRFTGQTAGMTQSVRDILCYQGFVRYAMSEPFSVVPQSNDGPVADDVAHGPPYGSTNLDSTS